MVSTYPKPNQIKKTIILTKETNTLLLQQFKKKGDISATIEQLIIEKYGKPE